MRNLCIACKGFAFRLSSMLLWLLKTKFTLYQVTPISGKHTLHTRRWLALYYDYTLVFTIYDLFICQLRKVNNSP